MLGGAVAAPDGDSRECAAGESSSGSALLQRQQLNTDRSMDYVVGKPEDELNTGRSVDTPEKPFLSHDYTHDYGNMLEAFSFYGLKGMYEHEEDFRQKAQKEVPATPSNGDPPGAGVPQILGKTSELQVGAARHPVKGIHGGKHWYKDDYAKDAHDKLEHWAYKSKYEKPPKESGPHWDSGRHWSMLADKSKLAKAHLLSDFAAKHFAPVRDGDAGQAAYHPQERISGLQVDATTNQNKPIHGLVKGEDWLGKDFIEDGDGDNKLEKWDIKSKYEKPPIDENSGTKWFMGQPSKDKKLQDEIAAVREPAKAAQMLGAIQVPKTEAQAEKLAAVDQALQAVQDEKYATDQAKHQMISAEAKAIETKAVAERAEDQAAEAEKSAEAAKAAGHHAAQLAGIAPP